MIDPRSPGKRAVLTGLIAALLILLCSNALAAASGHTDRLLNKRYRLAKANYHNLVVSEHTQAPSAAWAAVISQLNALLHDDRNHRLTPSCLFLLGRIHEEKARRTDNPVDLGLAITYYRDLNTDYPRHRLADDALLAMGRIYQDQKDDKTAASRTYARLVALYPHGDQCPEASQRLVALKGAAAASRSPVPATPASQDAPSPLPLPVVSPPTADDQQPQAELPSLAAMATIQPLKHWSNNDYTRIVIETSKPVTYTKSLLPKNGDLPRRLYVDLDNCRVTPGFQPSMPIGDGLLKQVRSAQFSPRAVRVVLDIESISDYKIFNLQDPFRVVIDVTGDRPPAVTEITSIAKHRPNTANPEPSLAQQLGLGIRKVVIDPGHGGKDPGAISPTGIKEKDVTLAVGKKVAAFLRDKLHCQVVMTRDRDVFVPLEERTAIANTSKGDLFLSIHVNAAPQPQVKGIETYFLDLAKDSNSMAVAARENATSAGQMSNLQAILMDLIQSTKINESAKLAECVQEKMVSGLSSRYTGIGNLGVKRAPFVVLIGAQMPSVLTEIAFLSNPTEAKRLKDPQYLSAVALQIVSGVSSYASQLSVASLQLQ